MARFLAVLFGIAFIAGGVAGYMPQFFQNDLLFGYFQVDTVHNMVHIATGVIAIMAATNRGLTKTFFVLFGLLYLIVGGIGYWRDGDIFIMQVNRADDLLHLGLGIVLLLIGLNTSSE